MLEWIEERLWLIPLYPRKSSYDVLAGTMIDQAGAQALSDAAEGCWRALASRNIELVGKYMVDSFNAQISMFPNMVTEDILEQINGFKPDVSGWKVSGAGGGGYLIFLSEKPLKNAIQIRIRRN
jgi:galactokinase/mevalonate kinase-like predicted kinase